MRRCRSGHGVRAGGRGRATHHLCQAPPPRAFDPQHLPVGPRARSGDRREALQVEAQIVLLLKVSLRAEEIDGLAGSEGLNIIQSQGGSGSRIVWYTSSAVIEAQVVLLLQVSFRAEGMDGLAGGEGLREREGAVVG